MADGVPLPHESFYFLTLIVMRKLFLAVAVVATLALATSCGVGQSGQNVESEMYQINFSAESPNPKQGKSVLVISASPRRGGNTDLLCDEFARGAAEAGAKVEKVFLDDYKIDLFREIDTYMQPDSVAKAQARDDAYIVINKMLRSDVIVLASPVYYLNINGQMKNLIDRTFYCFMQLKDKEFYYITASADVESYAADCAVEGFRGFVRCLPNPTERGMVRALGMGRKGGVEGSPYMQQAYELGKGV